MSTTSKSVRCSSLGMMVLIGKGSSGLDASSLHCERNDKKVMVQSYVCFVHTVESLIQEKLSSFLC